MELDIGKVIRGVGILGVDPGESFDPSQNREGAFAIHDILHD